MYILGVSGHGCGWNNVKTNSSPRDTDCHGLHTPQLDNIVSDLDGVCTGQARSWSEKILSFKCCSGAASDEFCPGHGFGHPSYN